MPDYTASNVRITKTLAVEATKARTNTYTALLILTLGTGWEWVVSFQPRLLYSQEINPSTHWIRFRAPQSRSGRSEKFWTTENVMPLSAFEPQTVHPVAQSLYRLLLNWKGHGMNGPWSDLSQPNGWRDWEKPRKNLARTACIPTKRWKGQLQNRSYCLNHRARSCCEQNTYSVFHGRITS
jgi:hypothetical protein